MVLLPTLLLLEPPLLILLPFPLPLHLPLLLLPLLGWGEETSEDSMVVA
jgi:hypothetical protein